MGKLFQVQEPFMRPALGQEPKYAVEHWHYSHVCPLYTHAYSFFTPDSQFIGCVLFGHGATCNIGKPYGLEQSQIYELVRVALNGKQGHGQTSRIVAAAMRQFIKDVGPSLQMIISYSDQDQGHQGIIYQATNWIYTGESGVFRDGYVLSSGRMVRRRSIGSLRKNYRLKMGGG